MEISKMQEDGEYEIKSGMYRGFTIEKKTEGGKSVFVIGSAKNVFEKDEKLYITVTKQNKEHLTEEDISKGLISLLVSDALGGYYDSLPAIPTNFWFKKMLPEILHEEFVKQSKGKEFGEQFAQLCNTMDAVKKTAKPTPYERPSVEKV